MANASALRLRWARVSETTARIVWRRAPNGDLVSPDGYWTIRDVHAVHLIRNGVDLGPYADEAQAQARAEADNPIRRVCRGSEMPPWRIDGEPGPCQVGECLVCSGWFYLINGTLQPHPTLRPEFERDG